MLGGADKLNGELLSYIIGADTCEAHKRQARQQQDARRGTRTERGYSNRWGRYRLRYLKANPLCVHCLKSEHYTPATCSGSQNKDTFVVSSHCSSYSYGDNPPLCLWGRTGLYQLYSQHWISCMA